MFRLDEQFLKDIGLDGLPEDQKKPFLQHIYSELELRVGTKLSDGLSDTQLEEFEKIIDRDQEKIQEWLHQHAPNYPEDESFRKLQEATKFESSDPRLVAEFTATKWLEVNRPDYRQVVAQVLEELKQEIITNRDAIIGAQASQQLPEQPIDSGAQPPQLPDQPPEFPRQTP